MGLCRKAGFSYSFGLLKGGSPRLYLNKVWSTLTFITTASIVVSYFRSSLAFSEPAEGKRTITQDKLAVTQGQYFVLVSNLCSCHRKIIWSSVLCVGGTAGTTRLFPWLDSQWMAPRDEPVYGMAVLLPRRWNQLWKRNSSFLKTSGSPQHP